MTNRHVVLPAGIYALPMRIEWDSETDEVTITLEMTHAREYFQNFANVVSLLIADRQPRKPKR